MRISLSRMGAEAEVFFNESRLVTGGMVDEVVTALAKSPLCGDEDGAK